MSSIIAAMDIQLGKNNHPEFSWSSDNIQEQIMQLYFQLVRTESSKMETIREKFDDIIKYIFELDFHTSLNKSSERKQDLVFYTSVILRLLCQTRDIVSGKGEYALAYMMLVTLDNYYPSFTHCVLESFVRLPLEEGQTKSKQPYGSWKDMKYIAYYVKTHCEKNKDVDQDPLVIKCIELINKQLCQDVLCINDSDISLCAKWVPREGSKKHKWFFKLLAKDFYKHSDFLKQPAPTVMSRLKALNKCYMLYRKLLAILNKRIDTVQIKQCGNIWKTIDHNKTTSITISRNKKAFLNVKKDGEIRRELPDRIICAENFKKYIDSTIKSGKEVKGSNVGLNNFTEQALDIIDNNKMNSIEADLLNSQWRSNSSKNSGLNKMIAMVDTSGSMSGDPLNVAIALGIRVAEKSILGKRVITFSKDSTWHNLDGDDNFVSMVQNLKCASWQMTTNFYSALKLILDSMVQNNVPPEDADGLVLAIFSDMQINDADNQFLSGAMRENIQLMYQQAGYKCPHLLFWNLIKTDGFPCLSNDKGVSMMSGFSPSLLNQFCEKGIDALDEATPWNMMLESFNNDRYSFLDQYVKDYHAKTCLS
jgi:hypothetical protein